MQGLFEALHLLHVAERLVVMVGDVKHVLGT